MIAGQQPGSVEIQPAREQADTEMLLCSGSAGASESGERQREDSLAQRVGCRRSTGNDESDAYDDASRPLTPNPVGLGSTAN